MRYLVLSDIHSNIEALDACLHHARSRGYDKVLCCGDLVGYGPSPVEVIDAVVSLDGITIRGNHDRLVSNHDEAAEFNPHAKEAIKWTRSVLPDSYREYLRSLPVGPLSVTAEAQLVHGAVTDEDDYIFATSDALENFLLINKTFTFFGHSHFPVVFSSIVRGQSARATKYQCDDFVTVRCDPNTRFLINAGSVGQSRDGDVRASFAIWDQETERIEFYRVEYDLKLTQKKMVAAHLPTHLIDRLARGR